MCSEPRTAPPVPIMGVTVQDAPYGGELIPLEPVGSVEITTICDNTVDILMLDERPAHRLLGRPGEPPSIAAPTLEEGTVVDSPRPEHGFSAHVAVTKGDRVHRMLFDTGLSPTGCTETENLARLGLEASDLEAIVLSHGHFDHTTGLSGLVRTLGRALHYRWSFIPSSGAGGASWSRATNPWICPPPAARPSPAPDSTSSKSASPHSCSKAWCS